MMKLGKNMKVFPLPSTQIKLHEQFVPKVMKGLEDFKVKVELKFVEYCRNVDMMMYNVEVTIEDEMVATELALIAQRLDRYCTNNDEAFHCDSRRYTLGDGDDSYAVRFKNGAFHIWLRGWSPINE